MRNLCFLLSLLTFNFCLAQKVRFQLHIVKPCTGAVLSDSNFTLFPQAAKDTNVYHGKVGAVALLDTGDFVLLINSDLYAEIPVIKIRNTGLFVYTYNQPRLYQYFSGALHDQGYYVYCDSGIVGYKDDFYPNGKCRMRGNFVKGRVKDSLVTFYTNGLVKKLFLRFRNGSFVEEFDSLGHKTLITHNKGRQYLIGYRTKEYYPDGRLKLFKSRKGELITIRAFYPNGILRLCQTKNRRVQYFENAQKKVSYEWKNKKEKDRDGNYILTVTKKTYDKRGNISAKFTGKIYEFNYPGQPDFEAYRIKYDWVISSEKFENGKVVFSVKNMDSDIYFKKYPED